MAVDMTRREKVDETHLRTAAIKKQPEGWKNNWFDFLFLMIQCKKTKMQINENKSICFRDRSSTLCCLHT